jgi:phosphopantetheinyl transferase
MLPPLLEIEQAASELATALAGVAVATVSVDESRDYHACALARLGQRERDLCNRFRCSRRRAEFIAGRIAARKAVARLLNGATPSQVEILRDVTGAPFVVALPSLRVSISHSNQVALAVAAHVAVGVDLEADEARPAAFSRLFFSVNEQERLSMTSSQAQQTFLNTLWTRKEAVSKVGHWGGHLVFAAVDCLDPSVRIDGSRIEVRSASVAGYVLSIAARRPETIVHG